MMINGKKPQKGGHTFLLNTQYNGQCRPKEHDFIPFTTFYLIGTWNMKTPLDMLNIRFLSFVSLY
jgi:hypothetical protein